MITGRVAFLVEERAMLRVLASACRKAKTRWSSPHGDGVSIGNAAFERARPTTFSGVDPRHDRDENPRLFRFGRGAGGAAEEVLHGFRLQGHFRRGGESEKPTHPDLRSARPDGSGHSGGRSFRSREC